MCLYYWNSLLSARRFRKNKNFNFAHGNIEGTFSFSLLLRVEQRKKRDEMNFFRGLVLKFPDKFAWTMSGSRFVRLSCDFYNYKKSFDMCAQFIIFFFYELYLLEISCDWHTNIYIHAVMQEARTHPVFTSSRPPWICISDGSPIARVMWFHIKRHVN